MQLNLGRWGDCDDMGFFMVTEALTPESGGWNQTLPLQESVVADACNQIELMIRQVRIRHDDLRLANMIFTKGRVHFIDFGQSYWLRQDLTDDRLDQIITEDQKILRELLL
jgi:tRNA A-37 threonylcarbamoyl transferase component Bud32